MRSERGIWRQLTTKRWIQRSSLSSWFVRKGMITRRTSPELLTGFPASRITCQETPECRKDWGRRGSGGRDAMSAWHGNHLHPSLSPRNLGSSPYWFNPLLDELLRDSFFILVHRLVILSVGKCVWRAAGDGKMWLNTWWVFRVEGGHGGGRQPPADLLTTDPRPSLTTPNYPRPTLNYVLGHLKLQLYMGIKWRFTKKLYINGVGDVVTTVV